MRFAKSMLTVGLLLSSNLVWGQLVYTQHFTEKINSLGLEFNRPTEQWWHLSPITRDSFFDYDLALDAPENGYSIRFKLSQEDPARSLPPASSLHLAITTAASNHPETYIRVKELTSFELDKYNADWGGIAEFRPKEQLTSYPKGKILAIYREEKGLALIMVFYESWDALSNAAFFSLMFKP